MSFDEEYIDPHGECAAEIRRLQSALANSEKRGEEAEARSTMLLGFTEEAQDKWQRVLDDRENLLNAICHLQSERDSLRSSLARVVDALNLAERYLKIAQDCISESPRAAREDDQFLRAIIGVLAKIRSALHRSQGE